MLLTKKVFELIISMGDNMKEEELYSMSDVFRISDVGSYSNVCTMLYNLEAKGLVTCEEDKYKSSITRVALTRTGREVYKLLKEIDNKIKV